MVCTEIKLRLVPGKSCLKAYAMIELDNQLILNDIRLYERDGTFFIDFSKSKRQLEKNLEAVVPTPALYKEMVRVISTAYLAKKEKRAREKIKYVV